MYNNNPNKKLNAVLRTDVTAKRFKAVSIGVAALVGLLMIFSCFGPRYDKNGSNCWKRPTSYLDPNHPKGFRTVARHSSDANYLVIRGRNSAHGGTQATFVVHGTIERGGRTLVADFSPVGGPPRLHGQCTSEGDIQWMDGNTWKRGARLSELVAGSMFLARHAADAILAAHAELEQQQQRQQRQFAEGGRNASTAMLHQGLEQQLPEGRGGLSAGEKRNAAGAVGSGSGQGGRSGLRSNQKRPLRGVAGSAPISGVRIKSVTDEGVGEPVTLADVASNDVLVAGFRARFPGVEILSEEAYLATTTTTTTTAPATSARTAPTVDEVLAAGMALAPLPDGMNLEQDPVYAIDDILVLVDPLDATKEFTEGLTEFVTTQQCFVLRSTGRPLAAVVHQPFSDEPPTVAVLASSSSSSSSSSSTSLHHGGRHRNHDTAAGKRTSVKSQKAATAGPAAPARRASGGVVFGGRAPRTSVERRALSTNSTTTLGGSSSGSGWSSHSSTRRTLEKNGGRGGHDGGRGGVGGGDGLFVAVSRSHGGEADAVVRELFGRGGGGGGGKGGREKGRGGGGGYRPLKAGGAGYKALLVIGGEAQGYLHTTKSKAWDACAADALLHALGGRFTDVGGELLRYSAERPLLKRGLLGAATKEEHAWFLERLLQPAANSNSSGGNSGGSSSGGVGGGNGGEYRGETESSAATTTARVSTKTKTKTATAGLAVPAASTAGAIIRSLNQGSNNSGGMPAEVTHLKGNRS